MVELPAELTIIPEDLGGDYTDGQDCPISRALERVGVVGHVVFACGTIKFRGEGEVGTYGWADGELFSAFTADRTGKLVLAVPARRCEDMFEEMEERYAGRA